VTPALPAGPRRRIRGTSPPSREASSRLTASGVQRTQLDPDAAVCASIFCSSVGRAGGFWSPSCLFRSSLSQQRTSSLKAIDERCETYSDGCNAKPHKRERGRSRSLANREYGSPRSPRNHEATRERNPSISRNSNASPSSAVLREVFASSQSRAIRQLSQNSVRFEGPSSRLASPWHSGQLVGEYLSCHEPSVAGQAFVESVTIRGLLHVGCDPV